MYCQAALNPDPEVVIPQMDAKMLEQWNADINCGTLPPSALLALTSLRIFTTDQAHWQIPQATTLYLGHDGTTLYAFWHCLDSKPQPRAAQRDVMDDLTLDDSVQILLGLPGGHERRQDMGGYENNQDKVLEPVQHFYEFTVNAVNSQSRAYNETLLPTALFTSRLIPGTHENGYWIVQKIPFASAGIVQGHHPKIYFNAFRHWNATRYGWYLPAFGNYAPMPFGTAILAQDGTINKEESTQDIPLIPAESHTATTHAAQIDAVLFEYYPISRKAVIVVPPDAQEKECSLYLRTENLSAHQKTNDALRTRLILQLPATLAAGSYEVEYSLGKEKKTVNIEVVTRPEWYQNQIGKEYVTDKVPMPWTNPHWEDGKLVLAHSTIDFGGQMLPSQIFVKDIPLLTAPISLEAKFKGQSPQRIAPEIMQCDVEPTRVALLSSPDADWQMRNVIDFDGFQVVRLRFPNWDVRNLEQLQLNIPLTAEAAQYICRSTVQSTISLGQVDYASNGGDLWIGSERIGLSISSDRKLFFSPPDGRQIEVQYQADGSAVLRLNLVTGAGQVPARDWVFQFFLIPTPTKTAVPLPQKEKMDLWFEEWSDYQGYPDLTKLPQMKERAAKAHAEGKELYMYWSQSLAVDSPVSAEYGVSETMAPPLRQWYRRAYDPGKGVPCNVSCWREALADLLLWSNAAMIAEGDIDAAYMDGTSFPFDCANPSHDCDDSLPVIFDDNVDKGRIIGHRQMLKRMRGIFNAKGTRFPLWVHTGGGLDIPTMSLCDYFYEGEQLTRYRKGYLLSPAVFNIGYSGQPIGMRTLFLPSNYVDASGASLANVPALVHGVEVQAGDFFTSSIETDFFALVKANPKETDFFGYWQDQPHLKRLSQDGAYLSYYRNDDAARLVAANLKYIGTQDVTVDLSDFFPGVRIKVTDLVLGDVWVPEGNVLRFSIPENRLRLFAIEAAQQNDRTTLASMPLATVTLPTKSFDAADWKLTHAAETSISNAGKRLSVRSLPAGNAETLIQFAHDLPAEFTMKLKIKHPEGMNIRLNDLQISFNAWNGWHITGLKAGDPYGVCNATERWLGGGFYQKPDTEIAIEVGVKNGRVSFVYDNVHMIDEYLLAQPSGSYRLSFGIWGGHSMDLEMVGVEPCYTMETEPLVHPVRRLPDYGVVKK